MKRFVVALLAMVLGGVGLSSISAQEIIERQGEKYELRPLNLAYEAQKTMPNTISLSVGTPMECAKSPSLIFYMLAGPLWLDRWIGDVWYGENDRRMASPTIHFSWRRLMNRTFSIGVSAAHSYTMVEDNKAYTDGIFRETCRTNVFLVGFRCDITYIRRGVFTMYGVLEPALGVRYQTMRTKPVATEPSTRFTAAEPPSSPAAFNSRVFFMPTFNIYPLCFRFGRRAGAFLEAGWGGSTCLKMGADYRF